jgi:hypothetical protein
MVRDAKPNYSRVATTSNAWRVRALGGLKVGGKPGLSKAHNRVAISPFNRRFSDDFRRNDPRRLPRATDAQPIAKPVNPRPGLVSGETFWYVDPRTSIAAGSSGRRVVNPAWLLD